jgi:phosphopantothenoylcysteine decarboxylase / phosphopantothenate---cysteine ligase
MQGKRVLIGITGGIAAYKVAYLIRLLKAKGAEVKCIMTPASCDFISPLVVATLSQNPVSIEFWNKKTGEWANHVELALWADVMVIAPATANTLAKMANGLCDNLLLATYLSLKTTAIICPAMDLDMYQHPTFIRNLQRLRDNGVRVIPAKSGFLASGLEGQGRMEEPEEIASYIEQFLLKKDATCVSPKKILITSGPTYEAIDPVRFIGNHSSGKMGFALAEAALSMGHEVVLISGPTSLQLHHPYLTLKRVQSAEEMLASVQGNWTNCQVGIFAAAVADFRPEQVLAQKFKKTENQSEWTLKMVKNPDVLMWASANRTEQKVIGFALETNNAEENALDKLVRKNLDAIVVNSLTDEGAGFQNDTNKIVIFDKLKKRYDFPFKRKTELAYDILHFIEKL